MVPVNYIGSDMSKPISSFKSVLQQLPTVFRHEPIKKDSLKTYLAQNQEIRKKMGFEYGKNTPSIIKYTIDRKERRPLTPMIIFKRNFSTQRLLWDFSASQYENFSSTRKIDINI